MRNQQKSIEINKKSIKIYINQEKSLRNQ